MHLRRHLHAYAVVRTLLVVELDEAREALLCVLDGLETALAVDYLRLEDAVHALRYGVVCGLVVLRHAYPDTIPVQFVRIGATAVLYASVRVVDEPLQLIGCRLSYGHAQGLQRILCLQRVGEAPAHDLARVGVRHQVEVAAAVHKVYIGDVAHPQLVRGRRNEAPDEVPVPAVAVVRVRRVARLRPPLHQPELTQQPEERVAPWHPVRLEHALHHQPQLVVSDARVQLTYLANGIHDAHHALDVILLALALLVIRLFRPVKQAAGIRHRIVRFPAKALYRLTPDFFLILMPCSSAMSISTLRA